MELPRRQRGDELLKPGEMTAMRARVRQLGAKHDLRSIIACAFDHRTRMLPFIFADLRMAPAGVRAIGSAMVDAGFEKTRIVLQQWNPNFRPSMMQLDGRVPDLFMVSSMQIHTTPCKELIRDACLIDPDHRPLIIAGGPKAVYEPWDVFSADPEDPWGADVAITGEEYVILSLLNLLLEIRAGNESMRKTFLRARNSGMLDSIPGLVYPLGTRDGVADELVDTGMQRLVGDLDETPDPVLGYRLLEFPSKAPTLQSQAIPPHRVGKYSPISSLVMTFGCKFACPYCPIPAYNQRQHRLKSGERIGDEITRIQETYGIRAFFGADDNFFNDKDRSVDLLEKIARKRRQRKKGRAIWGTEATVHDTLLMRDHLSLARAAGMRGLWLGVEDITATFIKKGQNADKTAEAFQLLSQNFISPMPMMMHHDGQPLYTKDSDYGLINQAKLLRKAGAVSLQVLMMTPATGSKLYESAFTDGIAYDSVDGKKVEPHMLDGNYVVASKQDKPWRKQVNIMLAYAYFYNPIRFVGALFKPKSRLYLADVGMQTLGMYGLSQTIRRTIGWVFKLRKGNIERRTRIPASTIPMRSPEGSCASHALPGTPDTKTVPLTISADVKQAS